MPESLSSESTARVKANRALSVPSFSLAGRLPLGAASDAAYESDEGRRRAVRFPGPGTDRAFVFRESNRGLLLDAGT